MGAEAHEWCMHACPHSLLAAASPDNNKNSAGNLPVRQQEVQGGGRARKGANMRAPAQEACSLENAAAAPGKSWLTPFAK